MDYPVLHPAGAIAYFSGELKRTADARIARQRQVRARHARLIAASHRIEQLEEDLARAALALRSLIDATLAVGALTRAELLQAIQRVDLLDGQIDGKLDPAGFRPPLDERPIPTTQESLRQLESQE